MAYYLCGVKMFLLFSFSPPLLLPKYRLYTRSHYIRTWLGSADIFVMHMTKKYQVCVCAEHHNKHIRNNSTKIYEYYNYKHNFAKKQKKRARTHTRNPNRLAYISTPLNVLNDDFERFILQKVNTFILCTVYIWRWVERKKNIKPNQKRCLCTT